MTTAISAPQEHTLHIDVAPDHAGRGRAALGAIFDNMVEELRAETKCRERSPELPEPMLGAMRSV